jgi:hypothetical protein
LSEPLCELRLTETAVVGKLERLPLLVWELAQRRLDALTLEAKPCVVFRRVRRRELDVVAERFRAPPILTPDEVDGAPVDERQQPGTRLPTLRHEALGTPPGGEEALLHGVLGKLLVAQDPEGDAVGNASEPVVELGEGCVLRTGYKCDDSLVREVSKGPDHRWRSLAHPVCIRPRRFFGSALGRC